MSEPILRNRLIGRTLVLDTSEYDPPVPQPGPRTVRDLIRRALRLAGGYGSGETVDGSEMADALVALNQMLDAWTSDGLMIFSNGEVTFPLIVGQSTYLLGPGGDFSMPTPKEVNYAFLRDQYALDRRVAIITREDFAGITLKNIGNVYPTMLSMDAGYPLSQITLFPYPLAGLTLHLGVQLPLTQYGEISTSVSLPPGYEDAIVHSLAEVLAPEYGRQVAPAVAMMARDGRRRVRNQNLPPAPAIRCEFRTGHFGGSGKAAFLAGD